MKLHHKIALYNITTKLAIIAISAIVINILTYQISTNHLQARLIDKKNKLFKHLSKKEIDDLVSLEKTFTDYNILKEEYISIRQTKGEGKKKAKRSFFIDKRIVEGEIEDYLIMTDFFYYGGKEYKVEIGQTMAAVQALEKTILYFTLITMAVSVVVTLLIDITFTQYLLRPFYWIIDKKINNVNDPTHFNYQEVQTSTNDFKLLDESISSLMSKISNQIIKEKQFISNVSHELQTPISIMMSRLENILNDEVLSDEGMNKVAASLKTLTRLRAIIHSLLLISKIENNQFPKTDDVVLSKIVQDIYEELEDRLIEKNITFENKLTYEQHILGNATLIHILCNNIINNAIKYNKKNGRVEVSDGFAGGQYFLLIQDEGIGMKHEEIQFAFNRFEKLGTTEADSHGLGLAIVKSIASFHGIAVSVESQKGLGTSITLSFNS